ncbi:MAG: hypothetical protein R3Y63_08905 [Eubacteriales bacterium]
MIEITKRSLGFKFCCTKCGCEGTFDTKDFKKTELGTLAIQCPQCDTRIEENCYEVKEHCFDTWSGETIPEPQDLQCGFCGEYGSRVVVVECGNCGNIGEGNDYTEVVENFTNTDRGDEVEVSYGED